jgi:heme/copper-type cytochrome/quinol oxidase subunit 4
MNEKDVSSASGLAAITIFLGVFIGGYILKISLEYLGFKNDGDMAIPVIIYVVCLVLFAIFGSFWFIGWINKTESNASKQEDQG